MSGKSFYSANVLLLLAAGFFTVNSWNYVFSQEQTTRGEEKLSPAEIISVEQLRKLQQEGNPNFILVDIDPAVTYNYEHIEGAINLPLEEIDKGYKNLPKNKLIITYCHCGAGTVRAEKAVTKLKELKFKKVAYLGNPVPPYYEYKRAGYPVAVDLTKFVDTNFLSYLQTAAGTPISDSIVRDVRGRLPAIPSDLLNSRIKNPAVRAERSFVIIDLREKEEYDAEHIPDAQNISLGKLFSKSKEGKYVFETLPNDKEIFIYCSDGKQRSKIAAEELQKAGQRGNVYYLEGGFSAWKEKGYLVK